MRSYKVGVITSFINIVGSILITAVFSFLLIDLMGLSQYGLWSIIFIIFGFSSFADMGISRSIILNKNKFDINDVFSSAIQACLIISLFVFLFCVLLLGSNSIVTYSFNQIILLSSMIILSMVFISISKSCFESIGLISIVNIISLIQTAFIYIPSWICFSYTKSIYLSSISSCFSMFLLSMVSVYYASCKVNVKYKYVPLSLSVKYISSGFKLSISAIINTAFQPIVRVITLFISGSESAGFLDLLMKFGNAITSSIYAFISPLLYKLISFEKIDFQVALFIRKTVFKLFLLFSFVFFVIYISYDFFLLNYYSEFNFALYKHSIYIVILSYGIKAVVEPIVRLMWVCDKYKEYNVLSLLVFISLIILLFFYYIGYEQLFTSLIGISIIFSIPYLITGIAIYLYFHCCLINKLARLS